MVTDILNADKKYITQKLVQHISEKTGDTECVIQRAFTLSIPTVFSALLLKSHDKSSIKDFLNLIISDKNINTNFLNNPHLLYSDNEHLIKKGKKINESLFQNKMDEICSIIKKKSGISKQSAKEILNITTTISIATLRKKANSEGWDENEVLNHIIENQNTIRKSTPTEIKETINLNEDTIEERSVAVTSQKNNKNRYWIKYVILAIITFLIIMVIKQGCKKTSDLSGNTKTVIITKGFLTTVIQ